VSTNLLKQECSNASHSMETDRLSTSGYLKRVTPPDGSTRFHETRLRPAHTRDEEADDVEFARVARIKLIKAHENVRRLVGTQSKMDTATTSGLR
jgi:hypothetical protein